MMEASILKRLAVIEQNERDIDKLESRVATLEAQIQSMGMVTAPEMPQDVRDFIVSEQRQDETEQETIDRLTKQYAEIMHRNQMGIPEPGDTTRLTALQRALPWFKSV